MGVAGIWFTMVYHLAILRVESETTGFEETIELTLQYNGWYKLLSVLNLFVLVLRFFKGFSAQPRLRIVVDSIVGAAVDLAHWCVIFSFLILTFVMTSLFLFGHRNESFSDVPSALFNTIRGWIVANSVPVHEFRDSEPTFYFVWWLLFSIIMLFVLQKMVLGIVLGAFVKTRNANKDSRTLCSQTKDFCTDFNANCKKLLKLSDVIHHLENPEYELAHMERVNLNILLTSLRQHMTLTGRKDAYAESFCLSLMEEFFANYDKIRDPDFKVRRTNAYARTTQLNDDFADLDERLDLLELHADEVLATLYRKFDFPDKKRGSAKQVSTPITPIVKSEDSGK